MRLNPFYWILIIMFIRVVTWRMELITFSKLLIDSPEIISLLISSHSKVRNPKSLQHHIKCSLFTCVNEKKDKPKEEHTVAWRP